MTVDTERAGSLQQRSGKLYEQHPTTDPLVVDYVPRVHARGFAASPCRETAPRHPGSPGCSALRNPSADPDHAAYRSGDCAHFSDWNGCRKTSAASLLMP